MIEAIQALPPIPTHEPLKDEATRAWLVKHGFDLTRWLAWSDIANEAGTLCRHFRQDESAVTIMPGQKVMLALGHGDCSCWVCLAERATNYDIHLGIDEGYGEI